MYGVCHDPEGRVLLIRDPGGDWTLPGGPLGFGTRPEDEVREQLRSETGLDVVVVRLLGVESSLGSADGGRQHAVQILYEVWLDGRTADEAGDRPPANGQAHWYRLDELKGEALTPVAARALDQVASGTGHEH